MFLLNNTEHQISYVLEVIKEELTRSDIMSSEFRDRVDAYFRRNTSHFIHELYNFARSPYDMFGYDLVVRYRRRQPGQVTIELSTSDSDNDEPVIINDVPLSNLYVATSAVLPAAEAGTSSAAMDGQQLRQPPLHSNPSQTSSSHSSNSNTSTAPPPASTPAAAPAEPISLDSSSDDDCQFVLARKPPHLRTPEYVSLNSDSDSDVVFIDVDLSEKANETLNSSGNSASTSGAGTSANAGSSCSNALPLKKRRNLSETHSTSSEDNKPLILHFNLKKNTASRLKRRTLQTQSRAASAVDSSSEYDEDDQDWEHKIKKTRIKSNRRKEVALHKYIKGAVNQGASTSTGFGVKTIYENSSDSASEEICSSDDDEDDDEDMRPLKPNDRTINIKIIKNQNSFCSVVNEGGSPMKRKRKTSKGGSSSSRKSSTKKASPRTKKKRNKQSSFDEEDDDDDGKSIDVVNRYDTTESSSNDSF